MSVLRGKPGEQPDTKLLKYFTTTLVCCCDQRVDVRDFFLAFFACPVNKKPGYIDGNIQNAAKFTKSQKMLAFSYCIPHWEDILPAKLQFKIFIWDHTMVIRQNGSSC